MHELKCKLSIHYHTSGYAEPYILPNKLFFSSPLENFIILIEHTFFKAGPESCTRPAWLQNRLAEHLT